MAGIDFNDLPEDKFDNPLGESTGAAAIFGTSGGVMEAALRTAYYKITGNELENLEFQDIRGLKEIKETTVKAGELTLNIAVVNGIGNVGHILDDIASGNSKYHFIEVMTCPGGCINGGGQPIHNNPEKVQKRVKALYDIDSKSARRASHHNESVNSVYKEFFGEPNSHLAHKVLHTSYVDRVKLLKEKIG